MKTTKEKIEVMQAAVDGADIEILSSSTGNVWIAKDSDGIEWDWSRFVYNVKDYGWPEDLRELVGRKVTSENDDHYIITSAGKRSATVGTLDMYVTDLKKHYKLLPED